MLRFAFFSRYLCFWLTFNIRLLLFCSNCISGYFWYFASWYFILFSGFLWYLRFCSTVTLKDFLYNLLSDMWYFLFDFLIFHILFFVILFYRFFFIILSLFNWLSFLFIIFMKIYFWSIQVSLLFCSWLLLFNEYLIAILALIVLWKFVSCTSKYEFSGLAL